MNAAAKLDAMRSQPLSLGLTTGSGLTLAGERRRPKSYSSYMRGGALTVAEKRKRALARTKVRAAERKLRNAPNVYADPLDIVDAGQLYVPGRTISTEKAVQNFNEILRKTGASAKGKRRLPNGFADVDLDTLLPNYAAMRGENKKRFSKDISEKHKSLKRRRTEVCRAYGLDYGQNFKEAGDLMANCNTQYSRKFLKSGFSKKTPLSMKKFILSSLLPIKYQPKRKRLNSLAKAVALTQGADADPYQYYKSESTNPWIRKLKEVAARNRALPINDPARKTFQQVIKQAKREYRYAKANQGAAWPADDPDAQPTDSE